MPKKTTAPKKSEKTKPVKKAEEAEEGEEIEEAEEVEEDEETEDGEGSEIDMTDEERAVLMEVVKAGDKGVLADNIAKKLKIPVEKVEQILDHFEESGWFYSEDEKN
ncbi:MAG: hypothetical protein LUQ65_13215 [Candidatus Helarchaeota archaeon]|nr:hypothetical protein [Candidatus Helarchaeota archaeon]